MNNKCFDIIFIGAGPSALFCAFKLPNNVNFLILEQGKLLKQRIASINNNEANSKTDLLFGVGGAGLFSDGKLNFSTKIGGEPLKVLSKTRIKSITEEFCNNFGINLIEPQSSGVQIPNGECLIFPQFHFGSDRLKIFIKQLIKPLLSRIKPNTIVRKVTKNNGLFEVHTNKTVYKTKKVIVATGQSNFDFSVKVAKDFNLVINPSPISVGFRLEAKMDYLSNYFSIQYDPKIIIDTCWGEVRTFCSNPGGYVISERKDGFTSANGHANNNEKSAYGNFALLIKVFGKNELLTACKKLSKDTEGRLIVQNISDFLNDLETKELFFEPQHNNYKLGFKIQSYLPQKVISGLKEGLKILMKVEPGLKNAIIYSPEIKVLHFTIDLKKNSFESTKEPGLYFIGDSSGNIHGLWNAIMSGVSCAQELVK